MLRRIMSSPVLLALTAFVALALLIFGWWTVSPLFIRTNLSEGPNIALASAPIAAPTQTAAIAMAAQVTPTPAAIIKEPDTAIMAQASPTAAAMMAEPSPTAAAMMAEPSPTAVAMMVEPSPTIEAVMESQILGVGNFGHKDNIHYADGQAIIVRQPDGSSVLRLQDLAAANGPDLFVYVSEHPDPANSEELHQGGYNLGTLKATDGSFNYALDAAIDPAKLRSVVIYCRAFSVIFSTAKLATPGS